MAFLRSSRSRQAEELRQARWSPNGWVLHWLWAQPYTHPQTASSHCLLHGEQETYSEGSRKHTISLQLVMVCLFGVFIFCLFFNFALTILRFEKDKHFFGNNLGLVSEMRILRACFYGKKKIQVFKWSASFSSGPSATNKPKINTSSSTRISKQGGIRKTFAVSSPLPRADVQRQQCHPVTWTEPGTPF